MDSSDNTTLKKKTIIHGQLSTAPSAPCKRAHSGRAEEEVHKLTRKSIVVHDNRDLSVDFFF